MNRQDPTCIGCAIGVAVVLILAAVGFVHIALTIAQELAK